MRLRNGHVWIHCGGTGSGKTRTSLLMTLRFTRFYCGTDHMMREVKEKMRLHKIDLSKIFFVPPHLNVEQNFKPYYELPLPEAKEKRNLVVVDSVDTLATKYKSSFHHRNFMIREAFRWPQPTMFVTQVPRKTSKTAEWRGYYTIEDDLGFDKSLAHIITTTIAVKSTNRFYVQCLKGHDWDYMTFLINP